jgi:hypothetical protein
MFLTFEDIDANQTEEYPITELIDNQYIIPRSLAITFEIISTENNRQFSWHSIINNHRVNCRTLVCDSEFNREFIAERCNSHRCPFDPLSRYIIFWNPDFTSDRIENEVDLLEKIRLQTFKIKRIMMANTNIISFYNFEQFY